MTVSNEAKNPFDVWLTVGEAAAYLKLSKKTLRNKMTRRILRKGVHYFRPPGMGTRFKLSALKDWMEGKEALPPQLDMANDPPIRMLKGYILGSGPAHR
jgi:excisionase family DNA binding protein